MTPVQQEIFTDGRGDCLRACIASILDLPLSSVPNFIENRDAPPLFFARKWLAERGYKTVCVLSEHIGSADVRYSDGPVVLMGEGHGFAPEGVRHSHAVVGTPAGRGFQVLHDPHPGGQGLYGEPDGVLWIL